MRFIENAAKKAEEMLKQYDHEKAQEDAREAWEGMEFKNRNVIVKETNCFLETVLPKLKEFEKQERAQAAVRTKVRMMEYIYAKDKLTEQETAARKSIETLYDSSPSTLLALHKNASSLFSQRNVQESELNTEKSQILAAHIKEIEDELKQLKEDDEAAGYTFHLV